MIEMTFNWITYYGVQLNTTNHYANWIYTAVNSTFNWVLISYHSIEHPKLSFNWMQILLGQIFFNAHCKCAARQPALCRRRAGLGRDRLKNELFTGQERKLCTSKESFVLLCPALCKIIILRIIFELCICLLWSIHYWV